MAKDKASSKVAAPAVASKPLDSVKAGRVTKPAKSSKAAPDSKKKVERESSPESDSSSDESDGTSASSASSDDGSDGEQEVDTKVDKKMKDDSDSDSDSSDSEEETVAKKAEAPKVNGTAKADSGVKEAAPKINGKAKASSDDEDDSAGSDSSSASSDSGSDSDSDSESDADSKKEADAKAGAEKAADDSSSASSSEDEDEAPPVKVEEPAKKRKAEAPVEQTPKKARVNSSEGQNGQVANLFVGNLSWNVDEEWLTREFEEFGELKGVRVITDRDSGRSKGYGYVEFTEVESAVQALEAKHESLLDGRNIRIDYSTPRPQKNYDGFTPKERSFDRAQRYGDTQKPPTKTLFVGNVSFSADENMLTELFQDYGTIAAVRLPTDRETGELKGFGYVEFTSIDESKAALEALNGSPIEGRPIRLDFAGERSNDSPRGGGGFNRGAPRGRGGFSDRGGRGGFNDRGRGRGGARGGRGGTTNRGGFGDFSGKKISF